MMMGDNAERQKVVKSESLNAPTHECIIMFEFC